MKRVLLTMLLMLSMNVESQVNYNNIQDEFVRACGRMDSLTVFQNVNFVDSIGLLDVQEGKEQFLMDYGQAYVAKYALTTNRNDLIIALNAYSRCWELFGSTRALYQLAANYAAFDCDMAKKYMNELEEIMDADGLNFKENEKTYRDQLAAMREFVCPESRESDE